MKFVYLLKTGNEYKVGIANNLKKRLASIQTANANKVHLVCARRSINAQVIEKAMHNKLREFGGDGGREWFTLTPTQALDVAIKMNKSPEVETADLIIEDIKVDIKNIIESYWNNLDREMRNKGSLARPVVLPSAPKENSESDEEMVNKAIGVVKHTGRASTSLLQREMRIGYSRASRIIDELEKRNIISPFDGAKPRKVLV